MLALDSIRDCFEGVIPAVMATAGADGMPNIAYLSQVQYVDHEHVALSYQFFNKTRQNILARPLARLQVTSPVTGAQYQLSLEFRHTETAGPLFENMKARLAGIASHTGMGNVFRLLGADLFRVHQGCRSPVRACRRHRRATCCRRCAAPCSGWPAASTSRAWWPTRWMRFAPASASAMPWC